MLECAKDFGESTIGNIKKNVEKIWCTVVHFTPLSIKVTTRVRNPLMDKMQLVYIEHQTKKKSSLSNIQLRSKTQKIYENLCNGDTVTEPEPFQASTGWLNS